MRPRLDLTCHALTWLDSLRSGLPPLLRSKPKPKPKPKPKLKPNPNPKVSLLFYGLDFAVAACSPAAGCNRYVHAATTSLVDVPGYIGGSLLADTRLGRRVTAALSLALGGSCLLLTAAFNHVLVADVAGSVASALTLIGKLCAASAFVQAYLFPAELFPTALRGAALGVSNVFGRLGTTVAPLAATAPALVVQLVLGSLALLAGLSTLLLPERRGLGLPD